MLTYVETLDELPEEIRMPMIKTFEAFREQVVDTVTKSDFKRLEASFESVTEAQARSEARLDRVEAALEKLSEAQAKSEARLDRVEAALEKLSEAQAKTEERVRELTEAQAGTEERLNRLEATVGRLAQTTETLAKATGQLARQVGGLSDTIGGSIEDISYIVLPPYLEKHYGVEVKELERKSIMVGTKEEEINIFGEGRKDGEEVFVVGEAKSNVTPKEVERFGRFLKRLEPVLKKEIFPLMFGFRIRLQAVEKARELGMHLIFSYGKELT